MPWYRTALRRRELPTTFPRQPTYLSALEPDVPEGTSFVCVPDEASGTALVWTPEREIEGRTAEREEDVPLRERTASEGWAIREPTREADGANRR